MPRPRVWGAGGGRARGPWWGAGEEEWKEVVIEGEDEAEKGGGGLVGLAGGGPPCTEGYCGIGRLVLLDFEAREDR